MFGFPFTFFVLFLFILFFPFFPVCVGEGLIYLLVSTQKFAGLFAACYKILNVNFDLAVQLGDQRDILRVNLD
jgi:hypothetical protein